MNAFECPGCGDDIYVEELVDGSCPLCGESCGPEGEADGDALQRSVELEKWLLSKRTVEGLKAAGLDQSGAEEATRNIFSEVSTEALGGAPSFDDRITESFKWRSSPRLRDYLRVKRCRFCGDRHLIVGAKLLEGRILVDLVKKDVDVKGDVHWICRGCLARTPLSALGEAPLPRQ